MPIDKSWLQSVDQIVTASIAEDKRVIGLTSPNDRSGVSTLSQVLAKSFALSRIKTLLVDLSRTQAQDDDGIKDWVPLQTAPSSCIQNHDDGYDLLVSRPSMENRFVFNNIDKMRQILDEELGNYGAIILDLPAVLSSNPEAINPSSCAAACDAVFLLCMTGQTDRSSLTETRQRLYAANAPLQGLILNDWNYETTGQSMANSLRRLRFLPGTKKLATRMEQLDFLN